MGMENGKMKHVFGVAFGIAVVAMTGFAKAGGGEASFERQRAKLLAKDRPVVYNTDGCDMLYFPTNLPVSEKSFCSLRLDWSKGPVIGTVSYCPLSSGFAHFTATKAGDLFTGSVLCRPSSLHNATIDFRDRLGTDSLQMAIDFCRREGKEVFVSIRMNDTHDASTEYGQYFFSPFKKAHPECLMGTVSNKPPVCSWTAVDFACPAVRAHVRKFVREFVENYDVDGIEYDFMRHAQLFKTVAWEGVATEQECEMMSTLMRDLRSITEEVGRRRGRPILVVARTPDSIPYAKAIGMDVEKWMADRTLDIWVAAGYFQLEAWAKSVAVARRHGVKFYASMDETRIPGSAARMKKMLIPGRSSREFYHARFAAAFVQGCDGVYLFNLEFKNLQDIMSVDPRSLDGKNKIYFATERGTGGYRPWHYLKNGRDYMHVAKLDPCEPRQMQAGETYAFEIAIGDDFAKAAAAGLRPNVRVLALTGLKTGERMVVKLNGKILSDAVFKKGLFTFKATPGMFATGSNFFEVTMPSAATLNDFAVKVEYR